MTPFLDGNPKPEYKRLELTIKDALEDINQIVKNGFYDVVANDLQDPCEMRRYSCITRGIRKQVAIETIFSELICMDSPGHEPSTVFSIPMMFGQLERIRKQWGSEDYLNSDMEKSFNVNDALDVLERHLLPLTDDVYAAKPAYVAPGSDPDDTLSPSMFAICLIPRSCIDFRETPEIFSAALVIPSPKMMFDAMMKAARETGG